MVGRNQGFAADFFQRFDNPAHAGVQAFHGFDGGIEHAAVAHHVAVGVVDHDHVVTLVLNGIDDFVGDFGRAHFRLQVVGRDFR